LRVEGGSEEDEDKDSVHVTFLERGRARSEVRGQIAEVRSRVILSPFQA
jgi:hypothetical protein